MPTTNFPGSLDDNTSLPNPGSGSFTNNPSHAGQHDTENDAIKALEAKVGIGAATPTAAGQILRCTANGTTTWGKAVLTTDVTGVLPVANGGTGQDISALATGILKVTTSTGVLSTAVAGDFPTLNQNTTGSAHSIDGTLASNAPTAGTIPITDASNILLANPYAPLIINGSCLVAQRTTAPSLSTTSQYGKVDRFRVHATGTAVSAGTITQGTAQTFGQSGSTLQVSGATITGTGVVLVRHRIEAKNAATLKNQIASFACTVFHDVGSSVNYTIVIRKPTASDNFASTTTISTSSTILVATSTATRIAFENVSLGDVSFGIEIEISVACGAVTTKNFHYTDFMLNRGTIAMGYTPRPFDVELVACQRYYEKSYPYADAPGTGYAQLYFNSANFRDNGGANQVCGASDRFETRKRTAPTMSWYNTVTGAGTTNAVAGGTTGTNYTSLTFSFGGETHCVFGITTVSSDFHVGACWVADAEL